MHAMSAVERSIPSRARRTVAALLAGAAVLPCARSGGAQNAAIMSPPFADPAAWKIVNDDVMGGVSSAQVSAQKSPAGDAIRFAGTVRLDFNGGFASMRRPWRSDGAAQALAVTARGDGNRYRLTVYTRDAVSGRAQPCSYFSVFGTQPAAPVRQVLPLAGFRATFRGRSVPEAPPLTPADVIGVGIMITKNEHAAGGGAFALELIDIEPVP
jgi:hypothetical protein